jgi:hypothetical protein
MKQARFSVVGLLEIERSWEWNLKVEVELSNSKPSVDEWLSFRLLSFTLEIVCLEIVIPLMTFIVVFNTWTFIQVYLFCHLSSLKSESARSVHCRLERIKSVSQIPFYSSPCQAAITHQLPALKHQNHKKNSSKSSLKQVTLRSASQHTKKINKLYVM